MVAAALPLYWKRSQLSSGVRQPRISQRRMHRLLTMVVSSLTLTGTSLLAQDSAPASASPVVCSYDVCALRLEEGRILQGRQGAEVGRLRWLNATPLLPLVGPSDSARFYAAEFDRRYARGSRWAALGSVSSGVVVAYMIDSNYGTASNTSWSRGDWALLGGLVLSIGAGTYGQHQLERARRGLARAIWWHNRESVSAR